MYALQLADGSAWHIAAETPETQSVTARLAEIMRLPQSQGLEYSASTHYLRLAPVATFKEARAQYPQTIIAARRGEIARYATAVTDTNPDIQTVRLSYCSAVIGLEAQQRGGVILHGALAAYPTSSGLNGILLCAPSGTGKTTASNRLPPPWISLCDDTTLVVRRPDGKFWAHPWPTWSCFFSDGSGGRWDTTKPVPLIAIFFLQQAQKDCVSPLKSAHAVVSLTNVIKQASQYLIHDTEQSLACTLRCEWFNIACKMVQMLPVYQLQLTINGQFWIEIEKFANFSYVDKEKMR